MMEIVQKELSYEVVGVLFKVHDELGRYATERQYGDLLERALDDNKIKYEREKAILVEDKKSSFVDFCIENVLLLDLKAKTFITKEDYYQMKRYLELTSLPLGIIVNFRQRYLKPKRILNPKTKNRS